MNISCVILAAGQSARMGVSKPMLKFDHKMNFLERIVSVYKSAGIQDIVVVINPKMNVELHSSPSTVIKGCKLIVNHQPELGRMNSIKIGLGEIQNSFVFIQNIDNPFVTDNVLLSLVNEIGAFDFAVPAISGNSGHPVLLSKKIIANVLRNQKNDLNLREFLKPFIRKEIQVEDPGILVNINTPDDYRLYFSTF